MKVNQSKKKNKGASLVEYGLLVALIALVAIASVSVIGTNVSTTLSEVSSSL